MRVLGVLGSPHCLTLQLGNRNLSWPGRVIGKAYWQGCLEATRYLAATARPRMGTAASVPTGMGLDGAHLHTHTLRNLLPFVGRIQISASNQPLDGRARLSPYTRQSGIEVETIIFFENYSDGVPSIV